MHHLLLPLAARKPHQCTSAWRHRLIPKRRNMFIRNQRSMSWAEFASDWNMVSNQQSFIDQSIDQWRDCFIACLKAKSKHFEHLLWCVSLWYVTVMIFKAYTTAVMNKLTHVSFRKAGWPQPSGEVVNFIALFCKFTEVSVCQNYKKCCEVWQSYCKNNKGAIFLPHSVVATRREK